ncbi:MAG: AAA family ATPase [Planctomycetes bacterium]|nr:AAA family ATPase [Planctomycetota bacterium]
MSYFKILGLTQEPFSTSPDPVFFYEARAHKTALTNLIIELRLRRGLNVILGDVGTGKTTLSRKLIQALSVREGFLFHIILDPTFDPAPTLAEGSTLASCPYAKVGAGEFLFLSSMVRTFGIEVGPNATVLDLKEALKAFLFKTGVEERKTLVLIIDEAQKLTEPALEVLRILLNYETNEYKLLQLVLLGQLELYSRIITIPNLTDRISFKYTLNPLDEDETREMIDFRLRQAGYQARSGLFTAGAVKEIHHHTKGYPRQVALLCHQALKQAIMKTRSVVDDKMVKDVIHEEVRNGWSVQTPPKAASTQMK